MLSRAESRLLERLRRRKEREAEGLFLAEGVRVVEELLASGIVLRLVAVSPSLVDTPRGRALADALAARIPVRRVGDVELRHLAATDSPQGVVAAAEMPHASLGSLRPDERAIVLALDAVQDPGNFGALARCAAGFGALAMLVLPGSVDAWNPKAVRAAAGATFRLPVITASTTDATEWLRRNDFELCGAAAGGTPIGDIEVAARTALFVGNEGAGLSADVAAAIDREVAVPIQPGVESLNVAVAAGILLYEMTREA